MTETQVSIRVPEDLMKRAERLVPRVGKDPAYSAWRISRAAVLRLALVRGLEELEARYGQPHAGGRGNRGK